MSRLIYFIVLIASVLSACTPPAPAPSSAAHPLPPAPQVGFAQDGALSDFGRAVGVMSEQAR